MAEIVAIVGRPNVGKSSLFNRLTRSRDSLVDNRPGITRDRLYATILFEDVPLTLVDTGGFEDLGQDPLVNKVREQVERAIEEADRIIFVVDGRQGVMPGDEEMAEVLRRSQKTVFLAVNKIDGPEHEALGHSFYRLGLGTPYPVSAAHRFGIDSLMKAVSQGLPATPPVEAGDDRIRVAVLGRPNVGKSSLINRILGSERVLVSELPGTTRDSVDVPFQYKGREYLLIDTAGIRRKAKVRERIDKFSMIKALQSLERCHVAVILLDAAEGVSEQDARICSYAMDQGKGVVIAINKWDLLKRDRERQMHLQEAIERDLRFIPFAPKIRISALTGLRVPDLFQNINAVYDEFSLQVPTPLLNKALQAVMEKNPPPRIGRGRLKFFYGTQTHTRPPTFVIFVNRPDLVPVSYERFLVNHLRTYLGFSCTPIRVRFKER